MAKDDAERKRDERERMRAKGFKRFETWLHPLDWPAVRRFIDRKNRKREVKS